MVRILSLVVFLIAGSAMAQSTPPGNAPDNPPKATDGVDSKPITPQDSARAKDYWTPERRQLDYLRYVGASDKTAKEVQMFGLASWLTERYRDLSQRFYEANRDRYTQAKVKVLFVSFHANPQTQTDPKAKKAEHKAPAAAKA